MPTADAIIKKVDKMAGERSALHGRMDKDVDLYLVCRGILQNRPNILLANDGTGNFVTIPEAGGAEGSTEGRGDVGVSADYEELTQADLVLGTHELDVDECIDRIMRLLEKRGIVSA